MGNRRFGDFDSALEMRETLRKVASEEIQKQRPRPRYATVVSVDAVNYKADVIFTGDPSAVTVNTGIFTFIKEDDVVRVEGVGVDKYIAGLNAGGLRLGEAILPDPTLPGNIANKSYVDSSVASVLPSGMIAPWGGLIESIPSGWLPCDGSAVSRVTYAALFAAIGVTHGAGDGSTTFNLPNADGRVLLGADETYTEGATGGSTTHRHAVPAHSHSLSDAGQARIEVTSSGNILSHQVTTQSFASNRRGNATADTALGGRTSGAALAGSTDSGGPGDTYYGTDTSMQPYLSVPFMIKV